jgi:hypothetical protein
MTRRRKRHNPEQIVRKLRDAEAMLNAGKDEAAVLQALEVSQSTFDRWTEKGDITDFLIAGAETGTGRQSIFAADRPLPLAESRLTLSSAFRNHHDIRPTVQAARLFAGSPWDAASDTLSAGAFLMPLSSYDPCHEAAPGPMSKSPATWRKSTSRRSPGRMALRSSTCTACI